MEREGESTYRGGRGHRLFILPRLREIDVVLLTIHVFIVYILLGFICQRKNYYKSEGSTLA